LLSTTSVTDGELSFEGDVLDAILEGFHSAGWQSSEPARVAARTPMEIHAGRRRSLEVPALRKVKAPYWRWRPGWTGALPVNLESLDGFSEPFAHCGGGRAGKSATAGRKRHSFKIEFSLTRNELCGSA
jgi:hypothetical protein